MKGEVAIAAATGFVTLNSQVRVEIVCVAVNFIHDSVSRFRFIRPVRKSRFSI